MGRGDNRRTAKVRRRKQWRRKKLRIRNKIEQGKQAAATKPRKVRASATAAAPAPKTRRTRKATPADTKEA